MNKYFTNITKNLNLKIILISVRKIKEAYPEMVPDSFHFKSVSLDDLKKEVLNLNPEKSLPHLGPFP